MAMDVSDQQRTSSPNWQLGEPTGGSVISSTGLDELDLAMQGLQRFPTDIAKPMPDAPKQRSAWVFRMKPTVRNSIHPLGLNNNILGSGDQ